MVGFSMNHDQADIEEAIEADPQNPQDDEENLQAKRPVWPLHIVGDGDPQAIKGSFNPRWSCPEGRAAQWWAYNLDTAGLTDGEVLSIFAKHYGVWLRD